MLLFKYLTCRCSASSCKQSFDYANGWNENLTIKIVPLAFDLNVGLIQLPWAIDQRRNLLRKAALHWINQRTRQRMVSRAEVFRFEFGFGHKTKIGRRSYISLYLPRVFAIASSFTASTCLCWAGSLRMSPFRLKDLLTEPAFSSFFIPNLG